MMEHYRTDEHSGEDGRWFDMVGLGNCGGEIRNFGRAESEMIDCDRSGGKKSEDLGYKAVGGGSCVTSSSSSHRVEKGEGSEDNYSSLQREIDLSRIINVRG